eukprot:Awhi_evm1s3964
MKSVVALAVFAAVASAGNIFRRADECCATVEAKAYLGSKCAGLALLDFKAPTDGSCFKFAEKDGVKYYTSATCDGGTYVGDIWINDSKCTDGKGVYPLDQGLECSTSKVTPSIQAALDLSCAD